MVRAGLHRRGPRFGHNVGVQDLGAAAAWFLAAVFAWAGAVKLVSPTRTATAFRGLGLPAPGAFARIVPPFELAIAVALLLAPRVGAAAALASLAAFTAVVVHALRSGRRTGCGCFGAATSADDLSYVEPARNLLLALAAGSALAATDPVPPTLAATVAVTALAAAGALTLGLVRLRQRVGVVWATPLPGSLPSQ